MSDSSTRNEIKLKIRSELNKGLEKTIEYFQKSK